MALPSRVPVDRFERNPCDAANDRDRSALTG
jgi:hypothetical protein